MPGSEITQSELVRAMVELGNLLTGPKPLDERMAGMCAAAAHVLHCDHLIVLLIEGTHYQGVFQHGLPPDLASRFETYRVSRDKPIVAQIEACETYLLFTQANTDPTVGRVAQLAGVKTVIIVPFTHPDGEPLGYITANYTQDKREVTVDEAELAMGMARLVQTTMLRYLETQRRREVSQALLQVADSERRRLSRDIHDDPLQRILALRVGLEAFRERLAGDQVQGDIDRFIEQCREASASLREVMLRTHPTASEMADLEQVLQRMVARHEFGSSVALSFTDDRSVESPSYLVPALNRIAQQAARNTMRHANAEGLWVHLTNRDDGTLLAIRDNGSGFDPNTVDRTRLGLVSMRERTELLGGTLTIDSAPGQGTEIAAWFPHQEIDTQ